MEPLCGTGQAYGSKSGFMMVAICVSCFAKEEEKIPRHHPHHINQPREHNGEDLTEGNQGARFSTRSFLLPSISLTLPVCRPVSGADPKRKKKKSLCPPIVGCTAHYLSLSLSFSLRGGSAHASPEVIISQHISQTGLIFCSFSNCTCIQPSRAAVFPFFTPPQTEKQ